MSFCKYKFIAGKKKNQNCERFVRGGGEYCYQHKSKTLNSKQEPPAPIESIQEVIPDKTLKESTQIEKPKIVQPKGKPVKLRKASSSSSSSEFEYTELAKNIENKDERKDCIDLECSESSCDFSVSSSSSSDSDFTISSDSD